MTERNFNLSNIPAEKALEKYFSALEGLLTPKFEKIPAEESLDRVTSSDIYAKLNSPHYNAAAMDGIAVKSSSTIAANKSNPITLKEYEDFIHINTGDPVNDPYDAVIMAEYITQIDEGRSVKIKESAPIMQHIRPIGENVAAGELIFSAKHKIRPIDIGVLLSGGIFNVDVYAKPRAAIFPTGSEIIDVSQLQEGEIPKDGKIIESNTRMYEAQIKQAGGETVRFDPVPDDYDLLKKAIVKAANEFDMVIINAGSSAGTEDYTVKVLHDLAREGSAKVIVHGVAMKPGKPTILAIVNGKPVIGTPGYPVSAWLSFETFASPVLSVLSGHLFKPRQKTEAVLTKRITSSPDRREYVRVTLENTNGKLSASPLARHSGALMSLVKADGLCVIEQGCKCIEAGETAAIELL